MDNYYNNAGTNGILLENIFPVCSSIHTNKYLPPCFKYGELKKESPIFRRRNDIILIKQMSRIIWKVEILQNLDIAVLNPLQRSSPDKPG